MKTYQVSTVTLAVAVIEIEADSQEEALDKARDASRHPSRWDAREVFGEVDLTGECVEVVEVSP